MLCLIMVNQGNSLHISCGLRQVTLKNESLCFIIITLINKINQIAKNWRKLFLWSACDQPPRASRRHTYTSRIARSCFYLTSSNYFMPSCACIYHRINILFVSYWRPQRTWWLYHIINTTYLFTSTVYCIPTPSNIITIGGRQVHVRSPYYTF